MLSMINIGDLKPVPSAAWSDFVKQYDIKKWKSLNPRVGYYTKSAFTQRFPEWG